MIVHRAFFQYRYIVEIPRFQVNKFRIFVLERERKRKRASGALSGTAELSDLKSNKKSCKGSLRPNDEKFALAFAFSRERSAAATGNGGASARERWKKKRELIPVNCSELKFAESALSN